MGDVGQHLQAEPGQAHLDGGETEHVLRMRGREAEDRRPADVLPCEVNRPDIELPDEKVQVFAMRAIAAGAGNASELGRRLSVSKQAAAKTIAVLQERGYVTRGTDPRHARRMRLQVTPLGLEVLRQGEAIFDGLRAQWERQIGTAQLENLETHLAALVGDPPVRFDIPGWMSRDFGEPV